MSAEDFQKKVSLRDSFSDETKVEGDISAAPGSGGGQILLLLRRMLEIQRRRAQAYAKLKRGFSEYMESGSDSSYQTLCSEVTTEFNDCSNQVREIETLFLNPDLGRPDLAKLLRDIQTQEKQKLNLTATIQVLKKAGRPSERVLTHENCKIKKAMVHECVHLHEITEEMGTEEAEADAEYDNALKEAIRGIQEAVTSINDYLDEIWYEIAALDDQ